MQLNSSGVAPSWGNRSLASAMRRSGLLGEISSGTWRTHILTCDTALRPGWMRRDVQAQSGDGQRGLLDGAAAVRSVEPAMDGWCGDAADRTRLRHGLHPPAAGG